LANAITAFRYAREWEGALAFNEFSIATTIVAGIPWNRDRRPWTDNDDILAAEWLQHHGIQVSKDIAGQAVEVVARQKPFHPVKQYLESLVWDGSPRLDTWLERHLGANQPAQSSRYLSAVGARWFISAVARIYRPGSKADHCLILEG